jgi:hypothetical protein
LSAPDLGSFWEDSSGFAPIFGKRQALKTLTFFRYLLSVKLMLFATIGRLAPGLISFLAKIGLTRQTAMVARRVDVRAAYFDIAAIIRAAAMFAPGSAQKQKQFSAAGGPLLKTT